MRNFFSSVLLAITLFELLALAQVKTSVTAASMIEIVANPEKFEGKTVTVTGFLVISRNPREISVRLYLHEEDAKYRLLDNSVFIIPSDQMLKDEEKLNDGYVRLTGRVLLTPTGGGGYIIRIGDVENCFRWAPPQLPR